MRLSAEIRTVDGQLTFEGSTRATTPFLCFYNCSPSPPPPPPPPPAFYTLSRLPALYSLHRHIREAAKLSPAVKMTHVTRAAAASFIIF